MDKPTLYLHIGATKTGTTALQRFLEQNSSTLLTEYGVLYPNVYDEAIDSEMQPERNYWQGYHFENFDSSTDLALFNKCIQYCKEKSLNSILFSHEALLVNWPDRIGALSNKLDAEVKIICYVRRQDHYLESMWKQAGYRYFSPTELLSQRNNESLGGWRFCDWYSLITRWAEYFGKDNIIVRPYEKEQLPEGLFSDFLKVINVTWKGRPELINKSVRTNPGFSRDIMEFMYLNKDFSKNPNDQRLYEMLYQSLGENYQKKPFENYGILSPKESIQLLQEFETSNQMLAREYLGRQDGRLFYEPWPNPDDTWEPYEGLTTEKVIPIFTTLIYQLFQHQHQLDRQQQKIMQEQMELDELLFLSRLIAPLKRIYRRIKGIG